MKPFLLIIIGPPAAGKTTISKLLSKELRAVHLQEDHFNGAQRWRKFKASETNHLSLDMIYAATNAALQGGYSVVIEGLFAREESKFQLLQWEAKLSACVILCYLRVDLSTLRARNTIVERGKIIKEKNVNELSETLDTLYGNDRRLHQVPNSMDDPVKAVARIRSLVTN